MKAGAIGNLTRVSCAALACSASFAVLADPPTDVMNIVRETDIKWVANPLVPGLASGRARQPERFRQSVCNSRALRAQHDEPAAFSP